MLNQKGVITGLVCSRVIQGNGKWESNFLMKILKMDF